MIKNSNKNELITYLYISHWDKETSSKFFIDYNQIGIEKEKTSGCHMLVLRTSDNQTYGYYILLNPTGKILLEA